MDPTFADHMRRYLATVIAEHQLAAPLVGGCTAGDSDLADGSLADHVLDVITAQFAEPELAPHVVHVKGARFEDVEPVYRVDPEDPAGERRAKDEHGKPIKETGRRYLGPSDCPDCTIGLSSRGSDFVCLRLPRTIELKGCHEGCVIACGVSNG